MKTLTLKQHYASSDALGHPGTITVTLLPDYAVKLAAFQASVTQNASVQCVEASIEDIIKLPEMDDDLIFVHESLKVFANDWFLVLYEKHSGIVIEYHAPKAEVPQLSFA
jgi:hypothetical protein